MQSELVVASLHLFTMTRTFIGRQGTCMLESEDLNSIVVALPTVCPLANYSTSVILVFLTVKWDNTHLCCQSLVKYLQKTLKQDAWHHSFCC